MLPSFKVKAISNSMICMLVDIWEENADATIPVSNATTHTPITAVNPPIIFPSAVIGVTSPYPTVVSVMRDHQIVSGIDVNISGWVSCSAISIRALEKKKAIKNK